MKVIYFRRRNIPGFHSIEIIFDMVSNYISGKAECEVKELQYKSKGLIRRVLLGIEAARYQKEINHITGDIHFIALFLRKKRTVLTIHDIGFMNHSGAIARQVLKWFWIILPIRSSAVVTTVSSTTKAELLKHVKVNPEKIIVVPNPVRSFFQPSEKQFSKAKPVILQIGTTPNKNIPRLIKAIHGIDCKLILIGRIDVDLDRDLNQSGIEYENGVDLSDEEMLRKYHEADIISFISTHEGFGIPIIEANAVGRVVITSNISSMPEVAGNAAHLVDPYDIESIRGGVKKVINDDGYREKLILNGFENKKRFNIEEIGNKYLKIYDSLMVNGTRTK